jgi:DNA-binding GntR family transcriptional regulator
MKHRVSAGGRPSLRIERSRMMLRERVLEAIRDAILEGEFKPGDRLVERELCKMTGVSRTSVREALRHLEAEGLVRSAPNRGPVVGQPTAEEAEYIDTVRQALLGIAGRLFAERGTDRMIAQLGSALERLEQVLAGDKKRKIAEETARLYETLIEGCGNPVLGDIVRSLNARVMFRQSTGAPVANRIQECLDELRRIVEAIRRRSAKDAEKACIEHIRRGGGAALIALTRNPA